MKAKARLTQAQSGGVRNGPALIVFDPDPIGGFAAGAEITAVTHMLRLGVFTMGTTLRWGGRVWRVRAADGCQKLERYR